MSRDYLLHTDGGLFLHPAK